MSEDSDQIEDLVTLDEYKSIAFGVLNGSRRKGHEGITRDELHRQVEVIAQDVRSARISLALLEGLMVDRLSVWVDEDGEPTWFPNSGSVRDGVENETGRK